MNLRLIINLIHFITMNKTFFLDCNLILLFLTDSTFFNFAHNLICQLFLK